MRGFSWGALCKLTWRHHTLKQKRKSHQKQEKDTAKLKNRIHSNKYNEQSVQKNTCFDKFSFFFQNYQNQGQSTEGKERKKEERNDDKKMKKIRIFLYPLYPIYKIKN